MEYRAIGSQEPKEKLDQIADLYRQMNTYLKEVAGSHFLFTLVEKGEEKWIKSVTRLAGKINHLIVAEDQTIKGFAYGNIRMAPEHKGGYKVGFISDVFVAPSLRTKGVGSILTDHLIQALYDSGAERLELDVFIENEEAVRFWKAKGFEPSLYKMIKTWRNG